MNSAVFILSLITLCTASKLQSHCPWTCNCDDDNNVTTVRCTGRYWTTVPPLPVNTSVLVIHKADITHLQSKVFFWAHGQHLTKILFGQVSVKVIDKDAFWGLRELKRLSIDVSNIENLPQEIFANLTKLTFLRLGGNKLKRIPESSICEVRGIVEVNLVESHIDSAKFDACFQKLANLTSVSLSDNPLSKISKEDFYSLRTTKLKVLRLSNCKLQSLEPNVFRYLPHLTSLDIGNNHLSDIDPNLFSLQSYLGTLYIHGNRFKTVPSKFLVKIPRLEELNLGGNKFNNLVFGPEFLHLHYLRMLDVGKNDLKILYNHTFDNLVNSRITQLVMDTCKLHTIEAGTFSPLKQLEELTLSFNPLSAKALETAFYGLQNVTVLRKLTIMSTNLVDLSNTTFQHLSKTSLATLEAQKILVPHLPSYAFQYMPNLRKVNLGGSDIRDIGLGAFASITNLSTLQLDNNKLVDLPVAYKTGLTTLETLSVKGNPIMYLTANNCMGYFALRVFYATNCAISHITKKAFADMKNLEVLYLSTNKIAFIHPEAFVGLKNIKAIRLDKNKLVLSETSITMFERMETLQKLDLDGNANIASNVTLITMLLSNLTSLTALDVTSTGLSQLPVDMFDNLTSLNHLQLSNNHISYWSPRVFKSLNRLELLTIRNNTVTLINKTSLIHLKSLRHLDASGNPFACTCDLLWFRDWIYSSSVYVDHLGPAYQCASPPEMRNTPLVNFKLTEKQCMDITALYVMGALILCYVMLVTSMTLMYRYRWYIRYWLYLLRSRHRLAQEQNDVTPYAFDAFVSYCHQDQRWVIRELLPKIEYEAKIRLCLHQRNWLAGRSIHASIVESIDRSRKTVLVLSNNFAQSVWCEIELSMAQHQLFQRKAQDTLVVILLEDIHDRFLTAQLKCLLTTKTYIQWPKNNHKKQKRFWDLLKKVLKPANPIYEENPRDFLII